jgi:hypothetical protein
MSMCLGRLGRVQLDGGSRGQGCLNSGKASAANRMSARLQNPVSSRNRLGSGF